MTWTWELYQDIKRELESVLNYLHALNADLLVAVKQGEDLYQASDNEEVLLVDIPVAVQQQALAAGMNVRQYILEAIAQFSTSNNDLRQILTRLLESDDTVAVKVRERLEGKEIPEIVTDLEKCLNISDESDRIYAVKNLLGSNLVSTRSDRSSIEENDELEILDLAEELLEKLADVLNGDR